MAERKLVEGWTGPIDETIRTAAGTPLDLTGMAVELLLQKADGLTVDTTGDITVVTPAAGLVRYSPDAGDLVAIDTPHVARWKITSAGQVTFFPAEEGEVWVILPAAALALQDNALLSFAELRHALAIKGTDQDLSLSHFINACADALESWTGRRLRSRTYTGLVQRVRDQDVQTDEVAEAWLDVEWPITAIASITVDGTAQTIWMPGDPGNPDTKDVYVLPGRDPKRAQSRLYKAGGWRIGAWVQWTYTGGYGAAGFPIPGDLKQPTVVLARDWYYLRDRQVQNIQSRSLQGEATTYINEALPRQFQALIVAYQRPQRTFA